MTGSQFSLQKVGESMLFLPGEGGSVERVRDSELYDRIGLIHRECTDQLVALGAGRRSGNVLICVANSHSEYHEGRTIQHRDLRFSSPRSGNRVVEFGVIRHGGQGSEIVEQTSVLNERHGLSVGVTHSNEGKGHPNLDEMAYHQSRYCVTPYDLAWQSAGYREFDLVIFLPPNLSEFYPNEEGKEMLCGEILATAGNMWDLVASFHHGSDRGEPVESDRLVSAFIQGQDFEKGVMRFSGELLLSEAAENSVDLVITDTK